ncbi:MAG: T9SS type A sorting domain-containing protein [Bacteroidota bacterium]
MKKTFIILFIFVFQWMSLSSFAQDRAHVSLLSVQQFNSNILVHGSTAPTTSWFCPDYYSPIDYLSGFGCAAPSAGYSASWNNYWMNFMRTPAVNCVGYDTVYLDFDLTNSFDATHPNDKVNFDIWVDGAYHDADINETILFDTLRNCQRYSVGFILTPYSNISGVLFYLNANCGYNDSKTYTVRFDNVEVWANGSGVGIEENKKPKISLFPNPSDGKIFITGSGEMQLFDINGKLLHSYEFLSNNNELNLQDLENGVYLYEVKTTDHKIERGRIVIVK